MNPRRRRPACDKKPAPLAILPPAGKPQRTVSCELFSYAPRTAPDTPTHNSASFSGEAHKPRELAPAAAADC